MVLSRSNIRFGSLNGVRTAVVFAVVFVLLSLLPSKALAATYTVCASGCDYTTINNALTASSSGDTITVSAGTYAENIDYGAKNITIQSASGAASTFIVGDGTDNPVVNFNDASLTSSAVLKGFTINHATSGGSNTRGIYIGSSASPTIQDSIIKGNQPVATVYGGGIYITGGTSGVTITGTTVGGDAADKNTSSRGAGLYAATTSGAITITDSTFSYNESVYDVSGRYGAAIYFIDVSSTSTITDTTIEDNLGGSGAGIYSNNSSLTVTNGSISNNLANGNSGGGIYIKGASSILTINGSTTMTGNSAAGGGTGGAIYAQGIDSVNISGATITSNSSATYGGGIYISSFTGASTISSTTINSNTARYSGGGLSVGAANTSSLALTDVILNSNSTYDGGNGDGGGIYASGLVLTLTGGTINGNSSRYGGGVYIRAATGSTISGTTINGNAAVVEGGGLYIMQCSMNLSKSFVQGNTARDYGGGIRTIQAFPTITNSVVSGNRLTSTSLGYGGGISIDSISWLYLFNSTVAGNFAYTDGGGFYANGASEIVRNSIIYGNMANSGANNVGLTIDVITTSNVSTDPLFVDLQQANIGAATTAGDYRLCYSAGEPAAGCSSGPSNGIDTANATNAPADDMIGASRPQNIGGLGDGVDDYDMGAYEYHSSDVTPPANVTGFTATDATTGNQLDLSWTNPGDGDFAGVKVVRVTGGTAPADCTDTAVYDGTGTSYNNTGLTDGTLYSYRACAYDAAGNYTSGLTVSSTPTDTTAPADVTGLSVNELPTQIDLSWTNPVDADYAGTKVLRKTGGYPSSCTDGTATTVYSNTGTSYSDTGVTEGTTYYYMVCSYDEVPNYPAGVTVTGTVDSMPPADVTGFAVTDPTTGDQLDLSWTNPGDADFSGVKVVRATGGTAPADCTGTAIYNGTGTSYNNTGLTDGTLYSYRACSYDTAGNYSSGVTGSSTPTDTTAPADVTGLSVYSSTTQIDLSWTNPGDADYAGTKVLRKTGGYPSSCTDGTATTIYNSTGTGYSDTGLTNGTVYYYRVCSYDEIPLYPTGATITGTPNVDTTPTAEVTGFTATDATTGGQLNLSWTNPGDADFSGVKVYRAVGATPPADCGGTAIYIGSGEGFNDTLLTNDQQYSYRVCTYDLLNNTSTGATGSGTPTDIVAPANVSSFAAAVGDTQITLTWANPTDIDFAGTKILRKTGGYPSSCSDGAATTIYDATGTSYVDTGLTNGTQYYYMGCSYDAEPLYASGVTATATPDGTDVTVPERVSDLAVATYTVSTINLTFTAPGDDGATGTATSYDVRYNDTLGITEATWSSSTQMSGEPTPKVAGTAESIELTGLACNTIYSIAMKSTDEAANTSSLSNVLYITTTSCDAQQVGGMGAYGVSGTGHTIPKYRTYTPLGGFSAQALANEAPFAGNSLAITILKEAPTRDEYIHASSNINNPMYIQRYDGSTWTNEWRTMSQIGSSARNFFNVEYEQLSGDALVVYEYINSSNTTVAYRTYNGTSWSGEQTFDYSGLSGSASSRISRIKMYSKKDSNEILIVILDEAKEVYSYIWDGSSFTNGKTITINRNAASGIDEVIGGAWEGLSGEAVVVFGDSSRAVSYATFNGSSWSSDAQAYDINGSFNYVEHIDVAGDPTSDYIGIISGSTTDKAEVIMWTGSSFEGSPPADDTKSTGVPSVSVAWLGEGGKALFVWANGASTTDNISYMVYTTGSGWSVADMNTAPTYGGWSGSVKYLELFTNPANYANQIMMTGIDSASDLYSIVWTDGAWSNPTNFFFTPDSVNQIESAAFAWEYTTTPYTDVSGFTVSAFAEGDRVDLSWTNPGDADFAYVKVVRATGATAPTDCSSGTEVYIGTNESYNDSAVTNGTQYSYRICAYNVGTLASAGLTGSATAGDSLAPADVTLFSGVPSNTQVTLSWTNPTDGDYAGTKILRKTGGYPSSCTDGTATTVYNSTGTSYNDTSLTNGTAYYYRACPYDEVPNYPTGATVTATPVADSTAPAEVTGFTAGNLGLGNQLNLSWTNPGDSDFSAVKIVKATGGTAPADCSGSAIYNGSSTSYSDTGLTDGQLYSYRACTIDNSSNMSTGVTGSGTPTDTLAPSSVTGFTASNGNGQPTLSWTNPVESDFAGTKILRKSGTYPSSCTDGTATTVYSGTGITVDDSGLASGTTYYYIACAYDEVPNYATSVTTTATPGTDSIPPAKITDLSILSVYTRGMKLTWTAPGDDDDTGTATSYDLRYTDAKDFTSNMSTYLDVDWGNLEQVATELTPQAAGSTESLFFGKNSYDEKVMPNTSYYSVIKSKDDRENISIISNEVSVHTAMKYGYNYMSLPYDASSGGSNTLQNLLGDDVPYVYIFKWTPTGLDWGSRFRGRWIRLSSSSAITSAMSNASGYYMYVYKANTSVLDEKDSGDSALVSENTDNWAKVDLVQGRNLVGNPYTKNVDFNNVKVCESSSFSTSGGCSGGTVKTFIEAVSAGWMDSTVAYYGNATTFTTETCNGVECVAKLRPWWGQWVYLLDGSGSYVMAVPKP